MIVTLQCNLEFDVNHLPEDFEEQVQNAFAFTDVCPTCNAELKEVEVNQNEAASISEEV